MMTLELLEDVPVIPVVTISRLEDATGVARALAAGGLSVLEITLRTPVAYRAIEAVRRAVPEMIVGAGTVTRSSELKDAHSAGAQFAVCPGFSTSVVSAARDLHLPVLPGVSTATEVLRARDAGFDLLKLFPVEAVGGVALIQALRGPFPEILFCPTGGIDRAKAVQYLAQPNVLCVGGSWLAPPDLVAAHAWSAIEALACETRSLKSTRATCRRADIPSAVRGDAYEPSAKRGV